MDRKAFIHSFVRLSILGAFAFLAGLLVSRRNITIRNGCSADSFCSNCRELRTCTREEAAIQRKNG